MVPQAEHRNVKVGNNVTLGCTLTKPEDVLQVTWQKDSGELHNNIATYSTMKGLKIHESYQGRMNFTSLVLNETSITFWDARMDDSGCYTCLFNTFPLGSMSGRTCLSVFGEILCRHMSLVEKEVFSHSISLSRPRNWVQGPRNGFTLASIILKSGISGWVKPLGCITSVWGKEYWIMREDLSQWTVLAFLFVGLSANPVGFALTDNG